MKYLRLTSPSEGLNGSGIGCGHGYVFGDGEGQGEDRHPRFYTNAPEFGDGDWGYGDAKGDGELQW